MIDKERNTMKKNKYISLLALLGSSLLLTSCISYQTSLKNQPKPAVNKVAQTASSFKSTADEVEPTDVNIYVYSTKPASERNWIWAWSDQESLPGSLFPVSFAPQVTFEQLGEEFKFTPVYLKFNTAYSAQNNWSGSAETSFTVTQDNFFTGLIIRNEDGSSKSTDNAIDLSKALVDDKGQRNIYIYEGKSVVYSLADFPTSPIESATYNEIRDPATQEVIPSIQMTAKPGKNMSDVLTQEILARGLVIRGYVTNADGSTTGKDRNVVDVSKIKIEGSTATLFFRINRSLNPQYKYQIQYTPVAGGDYDVLADVSLLSYYSSNAFDEKYHTNKKLGSYVANDNTTVFRLWTPSASSVTLNLYQDQGSKNRTPYLMTRDENGVYEIALQGNLHGYYYTFDIDNYGIVDKDVPDPYANSSNANGLKSMVVDFNKINSPEFIAQKTWAPKIDGNYAGVTIMEMHTRDFTSDASWNGNSTNKGKFAGLTEEGTSLADGTKMGFDYVKDLKAKGLTHVQIMPAYDFASVDETKLDDPTYQQKAIGGIFNWGYDPQQYNAPEGSYSSNPQDGWTRVQEFHDFVDTYNKAGLGVVMDVVYNHMPQQAGTAFERVFPGYYFRSKHSSGAGVDIASQRGMVRQFIVDSILGWAKNYHVSGFRFDLMGLLDRDTMQYIRQEVDKVDPNILIYGEGWDMFQGDPDYGTRHSALATKGNVDKMGEDWVGLFGDEYRDAVAGKNNDPSATGYVQNVLNGGSIDKQTLDRMYFGLTGTYYQGDSNATTYSSSSSDGIGASLAYIEVHDNMTLWDHFSVSRTSADIDVAKEVSMANDSFLSALSPAFFQLGQDFGRSKAFKDGKFKVNNGYYTDPIDPTVFYSHNSYNLSDEINGIDWTLLNKNSSVKQSFDAALQRRSTLAPRLGKSYSVTDFYEPTKGNFQANLLNDPQVISFSLRLADGKTYYYGQNFSGVEKTFPGINQKIQPYSVWTDIA